MLAKKIFIQIFVVIFVLFLVVTASSCQSFGERHSVKSTPSLAQESTLNMCCNGLLDYYEIIIDMPEGLREQELKDLRKSVQRKSLDGKEHFHELQLALLLMQQGSVKDYDEANLLLGNYLYETGSQNDAARRLALLLLADVYKSKQLLVAQERFETQIAKERDVSAELSQKLSELQSQLDQLKDIEKNINEKEQSITIPSIESIPHEPEKNSSRR